MRQTAITLDTNGGYANSFSNRVYLGVAGDNLADEILINCAVFASFAANAFYIKIGCGSYVFKDAATYADGVLSYTLKRNSNLYGRIELQVQIETATDIVWQSSIINCVLGATVNADAVISDEDAPYLQVLDARMTAITGMTVTAETTATASATWDGVNGVLALGIPSGATGATGATGASATINGVTALTIAAGDGMTLTQTGGVATLALDLDNYSGGAF